MNINDLKKLELEEIQDFVFFIEEYGHIFYGETTELKDPFDKILDGIKEVRKIVDNYYSY